MESNITGGSVVEKHQFDGCIEAIFREEATGELCTKAHGLYDRCWTTHFDDALWELVGHISDTNKDGGVV